MFRKNYEEGPKIVILNYGTSRQRRTQTEQMFGLILTYFIVYKKALETNFKKLLTLLITYKTIQNCHVKSIGKEVTYN